MTNNSITYADLYNFIIAQESIPQQYRDKAQDGLNALAKKSSKNDKNKEETSKRREKVFQFLFNHEGTHTREDIAEATGLTPNQISSAMSQLIKDEVAYKAERKEKGKGKKIVYGSNTHASDTVADSEDEEG